MYIIPTIVKEQKSILSINPFIWSVVYKGGKYIHLTAKEFDLLYFLVSHKGQVFLKEQLHVH